LNLLKYFYVRVFQALSRAPDIIIFTERAAYLRLFFYGLIDEADRRDLQIHLLVTLCYSMVLSLVLF